MDFNYEIVVDPQDTGDILNAIDREPMFSLDLETTGLEQTRDDVHGISIGLKDKAWYVSLGAENALIPGIKDLVKSKKTIIHNANFDLHFLKTKYNIVVPSANIIDTMIAQWLINENQELGLKALAPQKLPGVTSDDVMEFKDLRKLGQRLTKKSKLGDVTVLDIPFEILAHYAAKDARLGYDLWPVTEHELNKEGMTKLFYGYEMPFINVLLDMEDSGFYLDLNLLEQLTTEFTAIRDKEYIKIIEETKGINPNSPAQIAEYLYNVRGFKCTRWTDFEKTKPSTEDLALMDLAPLDKTGVIDALLVYREYNKLLTTYLLPFAERQVGGWLYGHFSQTGTVTKRLSSEDPNLQNIPAHGKAGSRLRNLFIAPPGYIFVDIDQSQLELRLAAHYTRDKNLLRVFAENGDPHQLTADLMMVDRFVGKTLNFSWFYGAGPGKLADIVQRNGNPRPPIRETKEWIVKFENSYPMAVAWKEDALQYARDMGGVKTLLGYKRRLPDLFSKVEGLRKAAERMAINAIIQGSAADIMKISMLDIAPMCTGGIKMNAQVHDELTFLVPTDLIEYFPNSAAQKMMDAGKKLNLRLALSAQPGHGPSWGDAKH